MYNYAVVWEDVDDGEALESSSFKYNKKKTARSVGMHTIRSMNEVLRKKKW